MKTKTFDCVEMKRRGAAYVHGMIKDMSSEEEVAFWHKRTEEMRREQERLRTQAAAPQSLPMPVRQ